MFIIRVSGRNNLQVLSSAVAAAAAIYNIDTDIAAAVVAAAVTVSEAEDVSASEAGTVIQVIPPASASSYPGASCRRSKSRVQGSCTAVNGEVLLRAASMRARARRRRHLQRGAQIPGRAGRHPVGEGGGRAAGREAF
jgi:hypothetical protein